MARVFLFPRRTTRRTRSDDDRQGRSRATVADRCAAGRQTQPRPQRRDGARPRRSSAPARGCSTKVAISSGPASGRTSCARRSCARASTSSSRYPGGVILPFYDILGDYPELRHVLVRHEQGGAHAADGYARVTGRVGVCMGTSGPGATNLVTGIGTALLDSVPMVAITGNVPGALIGKDAFQEIDINGITLPMTKHNYLVRDADDLPRVVAEAFHIARTGRPGPGPHRHHQGRPPAGDPGDASDRGRGHRRAARLPPEHGRPRPSAQVGGRRDRRREAPGHPGRTRRPPRRGMGRPRSRSPRRPRSRSPGRCSGSAPSTRPIRSPTATWGCTAGSTSIAPSRAPTC